MKALQLIIIIGNFSHFCRSGGILVVEKSVLFFWFVSEKPGKIIECGKSNIKLKSARLYYAKTKKVVYYCDLSSLPIEYETILPQSIFVRVTGNWRRRALNVVSDMVW